MTTCYRKAREKYKYRYRALANIYIKHQYGGKWGPCGFDHVMVTGARFEISETAHLLGFTCTTIYGVYTEWCGEANKKNPANRSSVSVNALLNDELTLF